MNWDGIESNWLQVKDLVRRHGSALSDAAEADGEIQSWLKSLEAPRAA